jgi:hypothetical protein
MKKETWVNHSGPLHQRSESADKRRIGSRTVRRADMAHHFQRGRGSGDPRTRYRIGNALIRTAGLGISISYDDAVGPADRLISTVLPPTGASFARPGDCSEPFADRTSVDEMSPAMIAPFSICSSP